MTLDLQKYEDALIQTIREMQSLGADGITIVMLISKALQETVDPLDIQAQGTEH